METIQKIKATQEEKEAVYAKFKQEELDLEQKIKDLNKQIKALELERHNLEMAQLDLNGRRTKYWHATR